MHPTVIQDPNRFDEFAAAAIAKGIEEVCITDHMPLSISDAADRIYAGQVSAYCKQVREIARRYAGRLAVRCGIEIDFHPAYMDEINAVLDASEFDYVLASSHFHVFMSQEELSRCTWDEFATRALDNLHRAVDTGLFSAVAHLDMYRWAFTQGRRFPLIPDEYAAEKHLHQIRPLLQAVADKGMRVEINPHLAEAKGDLSFTYPERQIVEIALDMPIRFSYGSDAHRPSSVGALLDELERDPVYGRALAMWEAE